MKQHEGKDGMAEGTIITDSRFLHVHSDPRFRRMPRKDSKVPIDSRFQHMFSDKNFSESLAFDKRGKPKKRKQRNQLHQYYYHHDSQEKTDNTVNQNEEVDEIRLPSNADSTEEIKKKNNNKIKGNAKSEEESMAFSDQLGRDENGHRNAQEVLEKDRWVTAKSSIDSTKKKKKKKNDRLGDLEENLYIDEDHEVNNPQEKEDNRHNNHEEIDEMVLPSNANSIEKIPKKNKNKRTLKNKINGNATSEEGSMVFSDHVGRDEDARQNAQEVLEQGKLDIIASVVDPTKKKKKKQQHHDGLGELEENPYIEEDHEDNQVSDLNSNKNKKNKVKIGSGALEGKNSADEDHEGNLAIECAKVQPRSWMEQEVNRANSNVVSKSNKMKDGKKLQSSGAETSDKDQLNTDKEPQWETTSKDSKNSKLKKDSIVGVGKKGNATVEGFREEGLEDEDDQEMSISESLSDEYLDMSESETSSSSDEDDETEPESPKQEEVPTVDHETRRLAVVNMDWNHVKAVDLLVLLNSFLPKGGYILSVAVYPSDFGLKQMAEDAVSGPTRIFESDDDSSEDDESELDNEKLRQYEKARLRYYYAVVECDSCATSDYLYKACDGVEFERTSNVLDLRFIPDDMKFDHSPRDVATGVPTNYQAPDFHTRALQHSKVKLSWDDDEPLRVKTLNRKFKPDQLNEMDFKAYLASEEEDDDESDDNDGQEDTWDGENKKSGLREKYRLLLLGSGDPSEGEEDKNGKDMEITFNTGLEELSKRILEKSQKSNSEETVWEAYLRKRREKRKARKSHPKGSSEDDINSSDREVANNDEGGNESDDFFLDDEPLDTGEKAGKSVNESYVKKATVSFGSAGKIQQNVKTQSVEARREEDASKAELELLIADDHGLENGVKGYNLKFKKSKRQKHKELPSEDKLPTVDYEDPRFSALFTSHHFAIDPTDPLYKRSAAYGRSLAQKQQKKFAEKTVDDLKPIVQQEPMIDESSAKKRKAELSSLIRSVKRKVGTSNS